MRPDSVRDRIEAAMLAHAAGDALGATLEFMSADDVAATYGVLTDIVGGGAFRWRAGEGTDDTDLSLLACESYADNNGTLVIDDVGRRLIAWADTRPPDIGNTTRVGIANYRDTGDSARSGPTDPNTAGNGSLMRALAPGLVVDDADRRAREADRLSVITHGAGECRAACVAYADIVHRLIAGDGPTEAIAYAQHRAAINPVHNTHVRVALAGAHHGLRGVENSPGGWVIHSLATAIGGLVDGEQSGLEAVIVEIANRGGDADTNAAIAGGLLGARHGIDAVPDRWIDRLEQRDRIAHLAAALTDIAVRSTS